MNWRILAHLPLVISVSFCGCSETSIAPVRGRVLCNSRPVVAAHVTFSPAPKSREDFEPGKAGTGFTDSEGRFVLSTHRELDGAQIGSHDVTIMLDDTNPAACKRLMHLKMEVKPGLNEFNLELNQ
jgi:hypothetical protein